MRQVLFIAYDFPPCKAMGGALRSARFAKYLPEYGWKTHIFTLKEEGNTYNNQSGVIRIPSATPYRKPYQVTPYGWAFSIYQHGKAFLRQQPVDLIYVSCPPFPQLIAALLLKKRFKLPLVVDFRDAWSLDPYTEGSRLKSFLYKKVFPPIERIILKNTDIFIVNTPSMEQAYLEIYPFLKNKTLLIPNGFDECDFQNIELPASPSDILTLVYCGRFGIGGRNPELLFQAIQSFVETHGNVLQLKIIGDNSPLVLQAISDFKLEQVVKTVGPVPHAEAINHMHKADLLVLYQEDTSAKVSAIAGKTYEYLRVAKAVLAIAPEGDNLDIIRQYATRYETVSDYNKDNLVRAITQIYTDWKAGTLPNDNNSTFSDTTYMSQYNRQALTKKLALIFDSMVKTT